MEIIESIAFIEHDILSYILYLETQLFIQLFINQKGK